MKDLDNTWNSLAMMIDKNQNFFDYFNQVFKSRMEKVFDIPILITTEVPPNEIHMFGRNQSVKGKNIGT